MSEPFGSMPADRELAAFGSAAGGVLLGVVASDTVSIITEGRLAATMSGGPPWLHALFAVAAVFFVSQVTGWALRVALIAFAVTQGLLVVSASGALSLGPWTTTVLHALIACALLVAAWPRAGRSARTVTVALFLASIGFKAWLRTRL